MMTVFNSFCRNSVTGEDDRYLRHRHHVDDGRPADFRHAGVMRRRRTGRTGGRRRQCRGRPQPGDVRGRAFEMRLRSGLFDGAAQLLRQVRQDAPSRRDHVPRIVSVRAGRAHIHRGRQTDVGREYLFTYYMHFKISVVFA